MTAGNPPSLGTEIADSGGGRALLEQRLPGPLEATWGFAEKTGRAGLCVSGCGAVGEDVPYFGDAEHAVAVHFF